MSSFTSLDELPREMGDRFSVAWQFTPSSSFDDHAMELNERHTALTLRAYGFGGLVVHSYFGENTTYGVDGVSVTDLNTDGSAAGSATASEARAALAAASVHYGGDTMQTNTQWPIATVRINRTELADRVASQVQTGANERRAQTHGLDAALRAGLRKAALQKARSDFLGFIPVEIISA